MGFIRDRIAARHHQSSCQPCDSQPHIVQSPCAPQPLVYGTPYANMGGGCQPCQMPMDRTPVNMPSVTICDSAGSPEPKNRRERSEVPPLPRLRSDKPQLPALAVEDLYQYDGGKSSAIPNFRRQGAPRPADDLYQYDGTGGRRPSDGRPGVVIDQTDRSRQLERELRIARDEIDNLKKQVDQMRADQRALLDKMAQQYGRSPVQPPGAQGPYAPPVAQPGQPGRYVPPPVAQPGPSRRDVPPPIAQPGPSGRDVPPPVVQPGAQGPARPSLPSDVKPPVGRAASPGAPRPWEAPLPAPVAPKAPIAPVAPVAPIAPVAPVAPVAKPGVLAPVAPPPEVKSPPPVAPPQPVTAAPRRTEVPKAGSPQPHPPQEDFVQKMKADSDKLIAAQQDRKLEDMKAPFDKFMQGERERLTRSMDNNTKDHPETTPANTSWLLSQDAEKLIRDFGYKKAMDDVTWRFRSSAVVNDENGVRDERTKQWQQVRDNAGNKNDPNYEKKQGVLNEIMNGWHIVDGQRFGRMNDERGDDPLRNNKLQWQVDAAEALTRVNRTAGISHDYSTRAIIHGLVGDARGQGVQLPVPEAARIKLLDAIVPMSKETGNAFLGANPKDTAVATVVASLERSHASRRPEEEFQIAAINKLMELDDLRGIGVLQKLSTESSSTRVKELATKQAKVLRDKIKL